MLHPDTDLSSSLPGTYPSRVSMCRVQVLVKAGERKQVIKTYIICIRRSRDVANKKREHLNKSVSHANVWMNTD
jgi:hypothetical protein